MIAKPEREQIIALINREVVPAIGCTEPIAVALWGCGQHLKQPGESRVSAVVN